MKYKVDIYDKDGNVVKSLGPFSKRAAEGAMDTEVYLYVRDHLEEDGVIDADGTWPELVAEARMHLLFVDRMEYESKVWSERNPDIFCKWKIEETNSWLIVFAFNGKLINQTPMQTREGAEALMRRNAGTKVLCLTGTIDTGNVSEKQMKDAGVSVEYLEDRTTVTDPEGNEYVWRIEEDND